MWGDVGECHYFPPSPTPPPPTSLEYYKIREKKKEQQNNAPSPPKNNADAGYQDPVKIKPLRVAAGLLSPHPSSDLTPGNVSSGAPNG